MSRSGSDKRHRQMMLAARFNTQEAEAVRQLADRAGTSVASVIRHAVLKTPPTRATRRPTVNHQMAARLLGDRRAQHYACLRGNDLSRKAAG